MDPVWNVVRTLTSKSLFRIGVDCYGTGWGGLAFLMSIGRNGPLGDFALFPLDASINAHQWVWGWLTVPVMIFFGVPFFGFLLNIMHMLIAPRLPLLARIPIMGGLGYGFFLVFNQNGLPVLPFWLSMPEYGMGLLAFLLLLLGILALGTFLSGCGRLFASPLDKNKDEKGLN